MWKNWKSFHFIIFFYFIKSKWRLVSIIKTFSSILYINTLRYLWIYTYIVNKSESTRRDCPFFIGSFHFASSLRAQFRISWSFLRSTERLSPWIDLSTWVTPGWETDGTDLLNSPVGLFPSIVKKTNTYRYDYTSIYL